MRTSKRVRLLNELEELGVDIESFKDAAKEEIVRRAQAERILNDPFLFHYNCIARPEQRPYLAQFHNEGLKFINSPSLRKLILWPRGHLKTSFFTQGETLRRTLKYPDFRVLLSTAIQPNSLTMLRAIRGHLQNPDFTRYFGNLIPAVTDKQYKNTESELTLLNRKNLSLPQATFTVTSMESTKTSQHYDLIVHDDLVTRENIGSVEMLEKTLQYYRDCLFLLEPNSELWVIGTRWHPLDLYGWILDRTIDPRCAENDYKHVSGKCKCMFDVSIKRLKENDQYIFPLKFNDEYMDILRRADGLDRYSEACQYYNNPADPSACWFKESDVKQSEVEPSVIEELNKAGKLAWYAAIDPAESTESDACLTAAVAVGLEPETGTLYVDWAEGRRVETPGFLDLCVETYRRYRPSRFGVEANTRKALLFSLKQHMATTGVFFTVDELKPSVKAGGKGFQKELRIKRLLPLFEHHRIKINKVSCKGLLDELYTIPASRSKDRTDALAYILDLIPPESGMGRKDVKLRRRAVGWKAVGY